MDTPTKQKIIDLRNEGVGYKRIASQLDVSINSVKSFCRTNWDAKQTLEAAEVT